jgi:cytochrome c oxidase subunit 2
MNVVPGLPTKFDFTPTLTTNEMRVKLENPNFDYILLCNKICGSAHYRMKMKVIVDTQADFDKWIKEQPALTAKGTEINSLHSFLSKENPIASN